LPDSAFSRRNFVSIGGRALAKINHETLGEKQAGWASPKGHVPHSGNGTSRGRYVPRGSCADGNGGHSLFGGIRRSNRCPATKNIGESVSVPQAYRCNHCSSSPTGMPRARRAASDRKPDFVPRRFSAQASIGMQQSGGTEVRHASGRGMGGSGFRKLKTEYGAQPAAMEGSSRFLRCQPSVHNTVDTRARARDSGLHGEIVSTLQGTTAGGRCAVL
jgi:hypothetical protein